MKDSGRVTQLHLPEAHVLRDCHFGQDAAWFAGSGHSYLLCLCLLFLELL
jgi:hypothetical protein